MDLSFNHSSRSFALLIRCSNCARDSEQEILVPCVDDAPSDVQEFLESAVLARFSYSCIDCESAIGRIIDVTGGQVV